MIGGDLRAGTLVAGLLAGLLLLAGCSDDGGERATPLPAETPTTSDVVTPTSPPPVVPVAPVAKKSAEGAEEFVRYFWAVYNYSYASGNSAALEALSGKDCTFCAGATQEISKAQTQGLQQTGGEVDAIAIRAAPGTVKASVVVTSVLDQEASRVTDPSGSVVATSEALDAVRADARLDWVADSWLVGAMTVATGGR